MPRSLLSPLRSAYEASPPLVGPDDLRAILNNGSTHPILPWYRTFLSRQLLGILMTLLGILALGYLLLPSHLFNDAPTPARPDKTPHTVEAPAPGGTAGAPAATRPTDLPATRNNNRATTLTDKADVRAARGDARTASTGAPAPTARPASQSDASDARERDARSAVDIAFADPSPIPAPLPLEVVQISRIESVAPIPEPSRPGGDRPIDSVHRARDSVWNYAGVTFNTLLTPRSFTNLNAMLDAQGYPDVNGVLFGTGLSYEFARPGRDSATPILFPAFLYPSSSNYTPGLTFEWMVHPEGHNNDGQRSVAFSSWTLLADNMYMRTFRVSRAMLMLSIGVNFTSLTLGRRATFDDLLAGTNPGTVSLSRSSLIIRPALRYDYCIAGLQMGLTVGYSRAIGASSWRMRSSLQFDPGISINGGPNDSGSGLHLGFSLTLRGLESMTPSQK